MISFSEKSFKETMDQRPRGYVDMVLKYGKVVDGRIWMTAQDHTRLAKLYRENIPLEPSLLQMTKNIVSSLSAWAKRGFPVATEEAIKKRQGACLNCKFWDRLARGGLGKCMEPKCGCTMIKWWLETEKCPIGKW